MLFSVYLTCELRLQNKNIKAAANNQYVLTAYKILINCCHNLSIFTKIISTINKQLLHECSRLDCNMNCGTKVQRKQQRAVLN